MCKKEALVKGVWTEKGGGKTAMVIPLGIASEAAKQQRLQI